MAHVTSQDSSPASGTAGGQESWQRIPRIPPALFLGLAILFAAGAAAFVLGVSTDPWRAWQIYLVNFLFWGALAQGGVVFAAIYHVVGAKWGPPIRRLAEGMTAFLPVSWIMFLPLFFGLGLFLARIQELNPARGAWFDPRFVFVRGMLGIGSMTVLSLMFVYWSLRPEVGLALASGWRAPRRLYTWLAQDWQGDAVERASGRRGMDVLSAGLLVAYAVTFTFMAFDLIMALDPFWYSSLFGGQFLVGTLYLGLAGVTLTAVAARRWLGASVITTAQLSDLGNLLLGFNLTYLAMLWSQYLVIWYGNLPEETHFIVLRLWHSPWDWLAWSSLALSSFIPFVMCLSHKAKETPGTMMSMAALIVIGLWLERYVLVVPSLSHTHHFPLGWLELGVTVGFLAAAVTSYLLFLRSFPIIPVFQSDAASVPETVEQEPSRA